MTILQKLDDLDIGLQDLKLFDLLELLVDFLQKCSTLHQVFNLKTEDVRTHKPLPNMLEDFLGGDNLGSSLLLLCLARHSADFFFSAHIPWLIRQRLLGICEAQRQAGKGVKPLVHSFVALSGDQLELLNSELAAFVVEREEVSEDLIRRKVVRVQIRREHVQMGHQEDSYLEGKGCHRN